MLPPENTNTHTYAPTKALIFTLFIPSRGHREGTPLAWFGAECGIRFLEGMFPTLMLYCLGVA